MGKNNTIKQALRGRHLLCQCYGCDLIAEIKRNMTHLKREKDGCMGDALLYRNVVMFYDKPWS